MNANNQNHRAILKSIAHRAMLERGLLPDFSAEALAELGSFRYPQSQGWTSARVLTRFAICASFCGLPLTTMTSLDLDQLTVAEAVSSDRVKIFVAIADVDSSIKNGSAIDQHARNNTTSVYTAAEIFPMLPEKVSTDITSLNFDEDRLSIVVEMLVGTGRIAW